MRFLSLCFVYFLSALAICNSSEWFTALSELESLLFLEHKLARPFAEMIRLEEKRLDQLEVFLSEVESAFPKVNQAEVIHYIGSPYNSYKVLSRFVHVWTLIDRYSSKNFTGDALEELNATLSKFQSQMPVDEDVHGAIEALFRLQDTYNVLPRQLADGMGPRSHKLGVEELFELGFVATGLNDYYHAKHYLAEAAKRFTPAASRIGFLDKEALLEYLGWAQYQIGDIEEAIETTHEILKHNPAHRSASVNLVAYQQQLAEKESKPIKPKSKTAKEEDQDEFDARCRGDFKPRTPPLMGNFICKYHSPTIGTLLTPYKIERVCSYPEVWVYKNVVTLYEINMIKQLSRPKLARATVHNPVDGKLMYADYRTSKSAWLREEENDIVAEVIERIGEITRLDVRFAEPLQVVNYGVGGHYIPHYDYARNNLSSVLSLGWGNRIATAMIYMSDVEEGGYTVFTGSDEGCRIKPYRGDMVFWYNMKRNGEGNPKTKHAACPVFIGNKWVANLWIHEYGQEFRRKCSLSPDE